MMTSEKVTSKMATPEKMTFEKASSKMVKPETMTFEKASSVERTQEMMRPEAGVPGMRTLRCIINSEPVECEIEDQDTLLYVLRDRLGFTGTKEGCGEGDCGACTVLVDGVSVNSCLYLAALAEGKSILTIEGVEKDPELKKIQDSFLRHAAVQCGFCSPGMIMSAVYLLDKNPSPTEEEIRRGISGNLCRCTGYQQIVDAIKGVNGNRPH